MTLEEGEGVIDKHREYELGFKLTKPCADCPFRMDKPIDKKYYGYCAEIALKFMNGFENISHSCHKTDPRSDCETAKLIDNKVHHCVGFFNLRVSEKNALKWLLKLYKEINNA